MRLHLVAPASISETCSGVSSLKTSLRTFSRISRRSHSAYKPAPLREIGFVLKGAAPKMTGCIGQASVGLHSSGFNPLSVLKSMQVMGPEQPKQVMDVFRKSFDHASSFRHIDGESFCIICEIIFLT